MFSREREAALVCLLLLLTACSSKPDRAPSRIVFVPFEYLGSAPEFDWIARALPDVAAAQVAAATAANRREAFLNRMTDVVSGYVTGGPGAFRAVATLRNEPDQRTVKTMEVSGASVLELASALARQLGKELKPYGTSNPQAVRALYSGNPAAAVALDPSYGAAHIARVDLLQRSGPGPELEQAIAEARAAKLPQADVAALQARTATSPKERSAAMTALARSRPDQLELWRAAADAALVAKDHKSAVAAFQKAAELDPDNVVLWNTMAYAQAFAGDMEGARRSIAEYRRLQPKDANALDSLGEIYFYAGNFAEAEKQFLQAFEMDNAWLGGAGLYRAALSRFLAGDRAKADEHLRRYLEFRQKHNDRAVALREAVWLYSTGRVAEARQKAVAANLPAAKSQIALWNAFEGKGPVEMGGPPELQGWKLLLARRYPEAVEHWSNVYERNSLIAGNDARVLLAWALAGAGRTSEAQELLAKWPLPPRSPDPGLGSLVVAKLVELKVDGR